MANGNTKQLNSRILLVMSLVIALIGAASPAWSDHEHMRNEVNLFHDFLQSHPKVSTELRTNPNLVNNKKYLDKHDELAKFLKRHPDVKRELVNHPSRIFGNYYRADQTRWSHNR
jgi:hypothetical protein